MSDGFSKLEITILKAKGLSDDELAVLMEAGVCAKRDFAEVGDAQTLGQICGASAEICAAVMAWAAGAPSTSPGAAEASGKMVIDSSDVVYCEHCQTKQPKDYNSGDLCISCGRQAETTNTCYWCGKVGPGKFCRSCGAQFVPTAELELAMLLRREGSAKDDIHSKLTHMDEAQKKVMWQRIRAQGR